MTAVRKAVFKKWCMGQADGYHHDPLELRDGSNFAISFHDTIAECIVSMKFESRMEVLVGEGQARVFVPSYRR